MGSAYARTFPSIYRGIVEDNKDPESLGRCRIRIPSIHGELTYSPELLPWARQVAPSPINNGRGSSNVPDIGDIVWVMFEGADRNFPIYLGGTYGSNDVGAPLGKVVIYTDGGNRIEYSDGAYKIITGESTVTVRDEGINLSHGDTDITLLSSGALIQKGSSSVRVTPSSVTLESPTVYVKGNMYVDGYIQSTGKVISEGGLSVSGGSSTDSLSVSGSTSVNSLNISGSCNRECNCTHD